MKVIPETCCSH